MYSNASFQNQLSSIMNALTNGAVVEITKLVDYSSALLFTEISRQRVENEALRKTLHRMQSDLKACKGTMSGQHHRSPLDMSLEVQICNEICNDESVRDQCFLDQQLDESVRHFEGAVNIDGETSTLLPCPMIKEVLLLSNDQLERKPAEDVLTCHRTMAGHGGFLLEDEQTDPTELQPYEENQLDVHTSPKREPEDRSTSRNTDQSAGPEHEILVKLEPDSEGESSGSAVVSGHSGIKMEEDLPTIKHQHDCSHCGRRFRARSLLLVHERVHTGEKPFVCNHCGKGFSQMNNLTKHKLLHRGGANSGKAHECNEYDKTFCQVQGLRNHRMNCHFNKVERECRATFDNADALLRHSFTPNKVSCKICGKSFATKQTLRVHQSVHTGNKPFICFYCGKGFAYQSNLKTHERIHTGERPFGCPMCGKKFTQKHVLDKHNCKR